MEITVEQYTSMTHFRRDDWQNLETRNNPFLHYDFLKGLEEYHCLDGHGWEPCHLAIKNGDSLLGALPLYVRYNSYGEFVFDWLWADAFERAGGRYYPKLVSAIPFTPVCGPRLLVSRSAGDAGLVRHAMVTAINKYLQDSGMSSWHCLFTDEEGQGCLAENELLLRKTVQFHWHNNNFDSFDAFLASLTAKRRKQIKRERRRVRDQRITIEQVPGEEITSSQWQTFYEFYCSTFHRRWGSPRLTLDFFMSLTENLPAQTLLILASSENRYIAGAFSMLDGHTLYGRHWGCRGHVDNLHFELCYYQTIDYCIRHGLTRVDAGIQGEHKVNRGFEPVATVSGHLIQNESFRRAVHDYLQQETREIDGYIAELQVHSPYKKVSGL